MASGSSAVANLNLLYFFSTVSEGKFLIFLSFLKNEKLVPVYTLIHTRETEVKLHSFLTSALGGGEW